MIYKSTKINKKDVLDILGEEGYLQILDENGEVLGEINKDTEVEDNNMYEIVYKQEVNKIKIKTSEPLKVGTIFLQNTREIKETVTNDEINRIQIDTNIECINNVKNTKEISNEETENIVDTEKEINIENEKDVEDEKIKEDEEREVTIEQRKIYNFNNIHIIQIKESETNIDLTMNRTEWTNNVQNEIEFTVKLITNNIRCKLFENPVIEIILPNEVEKVILQESSLLYANDGLKIENVEVLEDNGSKIIRAKLSGKQNDYYNNSMIEGTELLIPATIIVEKSIYDVEGKVELNVINNNTNEEKVRKQYNVNIISINFQALNETETEIGEEVGVGVEGGTNSAENIAEGIVTEINATLGEKTLGDGQIVYEHEYIRYNIKVKNESNYRKENINVIGKVPEGTTFVRCYFGEYSFETEDFYHIEEDNTVTEYNQNISLNANEEINLEYWIRANLLGEGETQKNIGSDISIFVGEEKIDEYQINNIVKKAKLELKVTASESDGSGNIWIYHFAVKKYHRRSYHKCNSRYKMAR